MDSKYRGRFGVRVVEDGKRGRELARDRFGERHAHGGGGSGGSERIRGPGAMSLNRDGLSAAPAELAGLRTMFASFHHFAEDDARRILADAVGRGVPVCVFEGTSRTGPAIASSLLIPLLVFLLTPAVRPVSLWRLAFTYLIPVLPMLIFWDGLVSHLRTYSAGEMLRMGRECGPRYRWRRGEVRLSKAARLPYLIGMPGGARGSSTRSGD